MVRLQGVTKRFAHVWALRGIDLELRRGRVDAAGEERAAPRGVGVRVAGLRALAVHAKDDEARAFYERYGFIPAPTDLYHLLVLLKDIKRDLGIV